MPYSIDWRPVGAVVTFTGDVEPQDIYVANSHLYGDERFDTHTYTIWNFERASLAEVKHGYADMLAAADKLMSFELPGLRLALVSKEPHAVEIFRKYKDKMSQMESNWTVAIFSDLESAEAWVIA